MNTNVELHASDLLDVAKTIKDVADNFGEAFHTAEKTILDLDTVWNDQNAKVYLEKFNELKQHFPEFVEAVESYSDFLKKVVEEYQKEFVDPTGKNVNG